MSLFDLSHNRHCVNSRSNCLCFNDIRIFSWNLLKHSNINNISFSIRRLLRKAKCWSGNLVNFAQSIEVFINFFDIGRRLGFEDIKSTIDLFYYPFKIRGRLGCHCLDTVGQLFGLYGFKYCQPFGDPSLSEDTGFECSSIQPIHLTDIGWPSASYVFGLNEFPVYAQVLRHD